MSRSAPPEPDPGRSVARGPSRKDAPAPGGGVPDGRLRPFRIAFRMLHITLVVVVCVLLARSVVASVSAMSPRHLPEARAPLTPVECLDEVEHLWLMLEERRTFLTDRAPARQADERWSRFRVEWVERLRAAEARCAVRSRSRPALRKVFGRLERVMDLYTIHAVQYAGEIGGPVDRFRAALDAARREGGRPGSAARDPAIGAPQPARRSD